QEIPQIPAFLPGIDQVPATQAMPLDGTWLISSIRKKIRIEAGRAYVIDPWVHLFLLKVEPGMVVLRNIAPTAPGTYGGEDLPLMGALTARVQADRSLAVSVQGALGPVNYKLIPMQLDNPQWYAQEMQAAGLAAPQTAPPSIYQPAPPPGMPTAPPPGYAPPPAYTPPPVYAPPPGPAPVAPPPSGPPSTPPSTPPADCVPIDIDPDTGMTICA
ncbi:MAG: hypothetical protein V2J24_10975, partial [Pseudomonadales bacterium]|nr:hypothetical protein [Pseudomonadales bacterium]